MFEAVWPIIFAVLALVLGKGRRGLVREAPETKLGVSREFSDAFRDGGRSVEEVLLGTVHRVREVHEEVDVHGHVRQLHGEIHLRLVVGAGRQLDGLRGDHDGFVLDDLGNNQVQSLLLIVTASLEFVLLAGEREVKVCLGKITSWKLLEEEAGKI